MFSPASDVTIYLSRP